MRSRTFRGIIPSAFMAPLVVLTVLVSGAGPASPATNVGRPPGDRVADAVLGQPNLVTRGCNTGGISASSLCDPTDSAVNPVTGRIYVGDDLNRRVLGFSSGPAFQNGEPADVLIGQDDFTSSESCSGQPNPMKVCRTGELLVDGLGNVYVTDRQNKRVLEFDDPSTTDSVADRVFGEPDMFTRRCRLGATGMCGPRGLAFDAAGNLYVSDQANHRVLVFFDPLNDQVADAVIGAPDFETKTGCVVPPSASDFCEPRGIGVDANGTLWVADMRNSRVMAFLNPLTTDGVADLVLGQPDFSSNVCNYGGVTAESLCYPRDAEITAGGTVHVADMGNSRVPAYFDPFGTDTVADRVFGQESPTGGSCNYQGPTARSLCHPRGVELDVFGNLYIADSFNFRVLRYDGPVP